MTQKYHPLFNTPQGRAQQHAMGARLRAKLRRAGPLEEAAAWFEYRHERFIEPGLEGLTGSDAVYHFNYVVGYISNAARTMAGHTNGMPTAANRRPTVALSALAKGYGWRYLRAVEGLHDALVDAGGRERFGAQCNDFADRFERQLEAASTVNERGENPNAAVQTVRLFAHQMLVICDWLEMTREIGLCMMLRPQLEAALETLHRAAEPVEIHRRKKRSTW